MDELGRAACTHVDLDGDTLKGIRLRGFKVEVILSTDLVPLVCLYARNFSSAYEVAVGHPVGSEDAATMVSGAAITTLICLGVVNIAVAVFDILTAGLVIQVMREAAVSVVNTVCSVNTVYFVFWVTNIVVISSSSGG